MVIGLKIYAMKVKQLVFKFEEDKNEFVFDQQLTFIEDKKLIKTLEKENIKNEGSSLIIKSMNNLPIYDVIQIKINLSETGTFLASFDKSKIDEKVREKLLAGISSLKDGVEPTKDTQIKKIKNLLVILDRYNPIYVTYKNGDDIQIDKESFNEIVETTLFAYPLLILKKKEEKTKEIHINFLKHKKIKKTEETQSEDSKKPRKEIVIDYPLFNFDYLFNALFCLLFSFGVLVSIFELINKESISVFLIIITVIFLGITYFSVYSTIYKKHVEKYKGLKYWILLYLGVGTAAGLAIGYIVAKFALKTENEIDYNLILAISIPSSIVLTLISIFPAKLINLISKKLKK